jgi:multiple sugar transport system permease protein
MTTAVGRVGDRTVAAPARRVGKLHREGRAAYLFLSPALLFFCVFLILPFLFAIVLSFSDWGGFDLGTLKWAGVKNFGDVLNFDGTFVKPILVNTLLFAFGSVFLGNLCYVLLS